MVNQKNVPCIVGSTGLVGSHLLKNLSNIYPKVITLTRKKVNYSSLVEKQGKQLLEYFQDSRKFFGKKGKKKLLILPLSLIHI